MQIKYYTSLFIATQVNNVANQSFVFKSNNILFRSDSYVLKEKAQIMGSSVSSKADILCCQKNLNQMPIIFLCEVCAFCFESLE